MKYNIKSHTILHFRTLRWLFWSTLGSLFWLPLASNWIEKNRSAAYFFFKRIPPYLDNRPHVNTEKDYDWATKELIILCGRLYLNGWLNISFEFTFIPVPAYYSKSIITCLCVTYQAIILVVYFSVKQKLDTYFFNFCYCQQNFYFLFCFLCSSKINSNIEQDWIQVRDRKRRPYFVSLKQIQKKKMNSPTTRNRRLIMPMT